MSKNPKAANQKSMQQADQKSTQQADQKKAGACTSQNGTTSSNCR